MKTYVILSCLWMTFAAPDRPTIVVVVGAEGAPEFGRQFRDWSGRWEAAAGRAGAEFSRIGLDEPTDMPDRELLQAKLGHLAGSSAEPLWLVLIGHGTFDGKTARFNLRGPDVTPEELAKWLKPIDRPIAIVNCASSSAPFLNELSGPNRVVVTATKSGHEYNFARFGDYLSSAIVDPKADLDKDDQVSLLEAFLLASAGVREFYEREGRLATEHALIDDNGDALGTPPDWYQGTRAVKTAKSGATPDGLRASQWHLVRSAHEEQLSPAARERRDRLEQELSRLRERKPQLAEDDYLKLLEPLLVDLARLYQGGVEPEAKTAD